jgi:hypothetical protein
MKSKFVQARKVEHQPEVEAAEMTDEVMVV